MQASLDSHLEEEQNHADLGEQLSLSIDFVDPKDSRTGRDTAEDLADHRGLAEPSEHLVAELGRQQDREQLEERLGQVVHRPLTPQTETAVAQSPP